MKGWVDMSDRERSALLEAMGRKPPLPRKVRSPYTNNRRFRTILANSSTSSRGRLVRLTAFPTAVKDAKRDAWQLILPDK